MHDDIYLAAATPSVEIREIETVVAMIRFDFSVLSSALASLAISPLTEIVLTHLLSGSFPEMPQSFLAG